jgi:hypothetical protein
MARVGEEAIWLKARALRAQLWLEAEARRLEHNRLAQAACDARPKPPPLSRREALRKAMRERMAGWGGARGSLLDEWKRLAS